MAEEAKTYRIIVIGAGVGGLLAMYKLRKMLPASRFELQCYEKNSGVGGTWHENKYPGCACDVPAHLYNPTFEQNPNWSNFYAGTDEIEQYFCGFSQRHGLDGCIEFNVKLSSATWDEESSEYHVVLEHVNGKSASDWCHLLVNASGMLNKPKFPDISGLADFQGQVVHTARWGDTNLCGKRVAVIGNGSSAAQLVPALYLENNELTLFAREGLWVSPPALMDKCDEAKRDTLIEANLAKTAHSEEPEAQGVRTGLRKAHQDLPYPSNGSSEVVRALEESQHRYTLAQRSDFKNDPSKLLDFRKKGETEIAKMFPSYLKGGEADRSMQELTTYMEEAIGTSYAKLGKLIPNWTPGCRRTSPAPGFIETLKQPSVDVVFRSLDQITKTGIVVRGREKEFDAIVCATGFECHELIGRGGIDMAKDWEHGPRIYLGILAPNFPNYFVISGPKSSWALGSIMPTLEGQATYIARCASKMIHDQIKAIEVKGTATDLLNEHIDQWHAKNSVYSPNTCSSLYQKGGKPQLWAGSIAHYREAIASPRWEDFHLTYYEMWSWLRKTGLTEEEESGAWAQAVRYIRCDDSDDVGAAPQR